MFDVISILHGLNFRIYLIIDVRILRRPSKWRILAYAFGVVITPSRVLQVVGIESASPIYPGATDVDGEAVTEFRERLTEGRKKCGRVIWKAFKKFALYRPRVHHRGVTYVSPPTW